MGTTILSFADRIVIETLLHEHRSLRYIADYLGFSKTTIFNELHRLPLPYNAKRSQRVCQELCVKKFSRLHHSAS